MDEGLSLSREALSALRELSATLGLGVENANGGGDEGDEDVAGLLGAVRNHFDVKDKEQVFDISYTSSDQERAISFAVKGIKKELGQTLSSTGLTIWRAAEHLCQYVIDHPEYFQGKACCELGAGLGLVSILLDKMDVCASLLVTDGDEDTMNLLIDNKIENFCSFETSYLYWGDYEDVLSCYPEKFDVIFAADVIYEEGQVNPLMDTVAALLKGSSQGEFLLAFARRNVSIDVVLAAAALRGFQWEIRENEDRQAARGWVEVTPPLLPSTVASWSFCLCSVAS
eukprot:gene22854-31153_t